MPFNWQAYLDFAKGSCGAGKECDRRIAVSRAYYAAYHRAVNRLREIGVDTWKHQDVWAGFKNKTVGMGEIANEGNYLRSSRHEADYRADGQFAQQKSQFVIKRAIALIESLDKTKLRDDQKSAWKARSKPPPK